MQGRSLTESAAKPGLRRPSGVVRFFQRWPLMYYRLGLGFLMGRRYIRITHKGRHSGRDRRTVLYVFHHDAGTGERFVGAVFGARSDWYRNVLVAPATEVQVGRRRFVPEQRLVPAAEAEHLIETWRRERPRYARLTERMRGASFSAVPVPVVAFRERSGTRVAAHRRRARAR
jgi:deazaflavin-dependent oxidoreductase (nitroreductase family)